VLDLRIKEPGAGTDYILTNHQRNGAWNGQRRLVMDREARIRWRAVRAAADNIGVATVGWSSRSGTFTIGGGWPPPADGKGRPQQLELYGSTVRYDTLPFIPDVEQRAFHHEARELDDGRLLALTEPEVVKPEGGTFRGFGAVIVDPTTDAVDFDWSSQRAFDEGHLPSGSGDAYHANWADVHDDAGQLVMLSSICALGWTVAIEVPSGDWRWAFGRDGDFDLVDTKGKPLPDDEYPMCQHGLQFRGDRLLVYDNGKQRALERGFSRAVEYQLDETTMTATKLWDWTEPDWWEENLGGVDYTTVGVLVAMAHIESGTPSPGDHTTFVEIDPTTGEKLWEVQYTEIIDMAYRAHALDPCDIFANAKYCPTVRERLVELAPILGP